MPLGQKSLCQFGRKSAFSSAMEVPGGGALWPIAAARGPGIRFVRQEPARDGESDTPDWRWYVVCMGIENIIIASTLPWPSCLENVPTLVSSH